jgi:hypothetical protein
VPKVKTELERIIKMGTANLKPDENPASLVFIHLSDIHFRYKRSGTSYDLDILVRNELQRDIEKLTKKFQRIDGILVSGDIAFGGKAEEYAIAGEWLDRITTAANCPPKNVFTIPGNHDIDRDVFRDNAHIYTWHEDILNNIIDADEKIRSYMVNDLKADHLFAAQKAYQKFAQRYGCWTTPQQPFWERNFDLGANIKVNLRGINSAILCSDKDENKPKNQFFVGSWQSNQLRKEGVINVCMCHHPSRWLFDQETFDLYTLGPNAVPLQLFGHEHEFQVEPCDNALRLYAGAVQPNRNEDGWLPRYNLIELTGSTQGSEISLHVNVWVRSWNNTIAEFVADVKYCTDDVPYTWTHIQGRETGASLIECETSIMQMPRELNIQKNTQQSRYNEVDAAQKLVNAFLTLPYHRIAHIANELNLVSDEDEDIESVEQFRRYFQRSSERSNGFRLLWDKILEYPSPLSGKVNPFDIEGKRKIGS